MPRRRKKACCGGGGSLVLDNIFFRLAGSRTPEGTSEPLTTTETSGLPFSAVPCDLPCIGMVMSLEYLPQEILFAILCYCDPLSAISLERTCHRFRGITNEPILWRLYCRTSFQYWDSRHDIPNKISDPVHTVNWKALYVSRWRIDRATSNLLDGILQSQTGRIEKFREIISFGYDIKDTLLRNTQADCSFYDCLARRYYAKALLTCLHRSIAISEWAKIRNGEAVPLDRALGAFDLFIPESGYGSLDEVSNALSGISRSVLMHYPDIHKLTCRDKAKVIATYLRANDLTGIRSGREYDLLQHSFLGMALRDPEHNSLPLISAVIYCYVAQRCGLDAQPCGFPFHVHVIVKPHPGFDVDGNALGSGVQGAPIYMDPFRSDAETPVASLRNQLNFLGLSMTEPSPYLDESWTPEIVIRCSTNIMNQIRRLSELPSEHLGATDVISAQYAALWSAMLLLGPSRPREFSHYMPLLMELFAKEFPSDTYLIEEYIAPLFRGTLEHAHILECLHVMRAVDEMPKQAKQRNSHQPNVRYRVGQVFRHRRYNYTGIITGWDTECDAGEQWMRRMGVDRLAGGRHQSFYHALVEDRSVRYVAEENIWPIAPRFSEMPHNLTETAGKHFKRWDEENHVFISNVKDEYPDD
ncbi:Hemimethylated DNA-binding protein YccV like-domain-containing protein [Aspergillus ambiguus]|uniref:Hemimethylated DNA-binding protein YccV like-domain-containing protein n=1 Tax=Aspergillus ambiguus TaxID=176160 RepID=UPI003CCCCF5A